MSSADHDWIMVLMQHRLQRSSSARGRNQLVTPVSPFSERASHRRQTGSRRRLASDNAVQCPGVSASDHAKMQVRKPTLTRRLTPSTGGSLYSCAAHFDIPFEISIQNLDQQRQDTEEDDNVSEMSLYEEDFLSQPCSLDQGQHQEEPKSSSASFVGPLSPPSPVVGVDINWGMTTLCLEDNDIWPSDEGSPQKKKEWGNCMPIRICSLDDERRDSSGHLTLTETSEELEDDDRHEQPVLI